MDIFERINMYDLAFCPDGEWGIKLPDFVYEIVAKDYPRYWKNLTHDLFANRFAGCSDEFRTISKAYEAIFFYALHREPVPLTTVERLVKQDLADAEETPSH